VAYDEALAERIRELIALRGDVTERKMFGGIVWMLAGNMACGVLDDELIVRLGPEEGERALGEPHTRPFDFTGRPTKGIVCIAPDATAEGKVLAAWVEEALAFAGSLPPK
jgi:TfoX/Sxy family transcriptional regulator of competence genes